MNIIEGDMPYLDLTLGEEEEEGDIVTEEMNIIEGEMAYVDLTLDEKEADIFTEEDNGIVNREIECIDITSDDEGHMVTVDDAGGSCSSDSGDIVYTNNHEMEEQILYSGNPVSNCSTGSSTNADNNSGTGDTGVAGPDDVPSCSSNGRITESATENVENQNASNHEQNASNLNVFPSCSCNGRITVSATENVQRHDDKQNASNKRIDIDNLFNEDIEQVLTDIWKVNKEFFSKNLVFQESFAKDKNIPFWRVNYWFQKQKGKGSKTHGDSGSKSVVNQTLNHDDSLNCGRSTPVQTLEHNTTHTSIKMSDKYFEHNKNKSITQPTRSSTQTASSEKEKEKDSTIQVKHNTTLSTTCPSRKRRSSSLPSTRKEDGSTVIPGNSETSKKKKRSNNSAPVIVIAKCDAQRKISPQKSLRKQNATKAKGTVGKSEERVEENSGDSTLQSQAPEVAAEDCQPQEPVKDSLPPESAELPEEEKSLQTSEKSDVNSNIKAGSLSTVIKQKPVEQEPPAMITRRKSSQENKKTEQGSLTTVIKQKPVAQEPPAMITRSKSSQKNKKTEQGDGNVWSETSEFEDDSAHKREKDGSTVIPGNSEISKKKKRSNNSAPVIVVAKCDAQKKISLQKSLRKQNAIKAKGTVGKSEERVEENSGDSTLQSQAPEVAAEDCQPQEPAKDSLPPESAELPEEEKSFQTSEKSDVNSNIKAGSLSTVIKQKPVVQEPPAMITRRKSSQENKKTKQGSLTTVIKQKPVEQEPPAMITRRKSSQENKKTEQGDGNVWSETSEFEDDSAHKRKKDDNTVIPGNSETSKKKKRSNNSAPVIVVAKCDAQKKVSPQKSLRKQNATKAKGAVGKSEERVEENSGDSTLQSQAPEVAAEDCQPQEPAKDSLPPESAELPEEEKSLQTSEKRDVNSNIKAGSLSTVIKQKPVEQEPPAMITRRKSSQENKKTEQGDGNVWSETSEFEDDSVHKRPSRRGKSVINDEQFAILEDAFINDKHKSRGYRAKLARDLQLPTKYVHNWFTNRYYRDYKRGKQGIIFTCNKGNTSVGTVTVKQEPVSDTDDFCDVDMQQSLLNGALCPMSPDSSSNKRNKCISDNRQSAVLEAVYSDNKFPDTRTCFKLSRELGLPYKFMLRWFENRRSRDRQNRQVLPSMRRNTLSKYDTIRLSPIQGNDDSANNTDQTCEIKTSTNPVGSETVTGEPLSVGFSKSQDDQSGSKNEPDMNSTQTVSEPKPTNSTREKRRSSRLMNYPYQCAQCGKRFKQNIDAEAHMLVHGFTIKSDPEEYMPGNTPGSDDESKTLLFPVHEKV